MTNGGDSGENQRTRRETIKLGNLYNRERNKQTTSKQNRASGGPVGLQEESPGEEK